LPARVLSRLFRRLFLTGLADAHTAGRLAFFSEHGGLRSRSAFAAYLAPLRKKNWFVYAKPPFTGPEAVLAYLAQLSLALILFASAQKGQASPNFRREYSALIGRVSSTGSLSHSRKILPMLSFANSPILIMVQPLWGLGRL